MISGVIIEHKQSLVHNQSKTIHLSWPFSSHFSHVIFYEHCSLLDQIPFPNYLKNQMSLIQIRLEVSSSAFGSHSSSTWRICGLIKKKVESIVTKKRLLFRYATGPSVYCHEIFFLAISAQLAITTKPYCPSLFVVIVSFLSFATICCAFFR